ncbi:peptide MFS transporter [Nonomuraea sp. NPDC050556]|uniref:peptide MFS transporter n=1 Tax=Nonomuraea sp. NPDC050556 TaxID=3364369 RepID=UPI0037BD6DAE
MKTGEKTFFGHPWGLATLFSTEMWERFSYYGMRAILVLFLTAPAARDGMGLSDTTAAGIYGVYVGSVYLTALVGGWVADRILGARRTVLWGGVVIMSGHISMAIPSNGATVWLGLILIALGSGLLKPNISTMVGELYRQDADQRRDAGFALFYMGVNLGAFLGILFVPMIAPADGDTWHRGFSLAAIGMALGLVQYVLGRKSLRGAGDRAEHRLTPEESSRFKKATIGGAVAVVVVLAVWGWSGTFTLDRFTLAFTIVCAVVPIAYFAFLFRSSEVTPQERVKLRAYVWLFLAAAIFWMIYDQAGSALTLFAKDSTDLTVFGISIDPGQVSNVNSVAIIALSPVFSVLWNRYGDRISIPFRFAIALVFVGASFVVMSLAAGQASTGVKVSILWLTATYLIQTLGELCLSPVGLSVTNKLAPKAFLSQMMGVWFLATALGDSVGGQMYKLTTVVSLPMYFLSLALSAIVAGLFMMVFIRRLRTLMGD